MEAKLKEQNIDWEWKENGDLKMWNVLPAFFQHPVTHEEILIHQTLSSHCTYYQYHPMVGLNHKFYGELIFHSLY